MATSENLPAYYNLSNLLHHSTNQSVMSNTSSLEEDLKQITPLRDTLQSTEAPCEPVVGPTYDPVQYAARQDDYWQWFRAQAAIDGTRVHKCPGPVTLRPLFRNLKATPTSNPHPSVVEPRSRCNRAFRRILRPGIHALQEWRRFRDWRAAQERFPTQSCYRLELGTQDPDGPKDAPRWRVKWVFECRDLDDSVNVDVAKIKARKLDGRGPGTYFAANGDWVWENRPCEILDGVWLGEVPSVANSQDLRASGILPWQ